ncbi:MAG: hypothetical protein K2X81_01385 [Candidatus Obscuribacterales bacterium]|nr:hypothetical protein [Candidatus Obscuribacterales bacterium]
MTSAALASVGQQCTVTELAAIVGCHRSTIRKNADVCALVLFRVDRGHPTRARIAEAVEILSKSNQLLTYSTIAAIAKCGTTTVQRNRELWEHLVPKKQIASKKLADPAAHPNEIWREGVQNVISLDNDSLQLKERQELILRLSWFASIAPTSEDVVWCIREMQSMEPKQASREAVAS